MAETITAPGEPETHSDDEGFPINAAALPEGCKPGDTIQMKVIAHNGDGEAMLKCVEEKKEMSWDEDLDKSMAEPQATEGGGAEEVT
jgi:hypothetical protein